MDLNVLKDLDSGLTSEGFFYNITNLVTQDMKKTPRSDECFEIINNVLIVSKNICDFLLLDNSEKKYNPYLFRDFVFDNFTELNSESENYLDNLYKIIERAPECHTLYKTAFYYAVAIVHRVANIQSFVRGDNEAFLDTIYDKGVFGRVLLDIENVMSIYEECNIIVYAINHNIGEFFKEINKETGIIDRINSFKGSVAETSFDIDKLEYKAMLNKDFEYSINFKIDNYKPIFNSIIPDGMFLQALTIPSVKFIANVSWITSNRQEKFRTNLTTYDRIIDGNNELYKYIAIDSYLTGIPFHFNIEEFKGKALRHLHMIKMLKDKYIFMFEYIEANLKVIDMETSFGENLITSFKAGIK